MAVPAHFRRSSVAALALVTTLAPAVVHAESGRLEEILVTGSRIARPDFVSASPIVSVPATAFRESSPVSVERTLAMLPQFVPTVTATANEPSNDGQANLSLRGVGVGQTLVLVDGRRLIPADGRGSVDLNVLPPMLIENVEVVTGGASAVYGSDAIAGVVNFHLRDEFDGVEAHGEWTQTAHGDGQEFSAGILAGTSFAGERGDVVAYVGYAEREQLNQGARRFSRYPYQYYEGVTYGFGPGGAFLAAGDFLSDIGFAAVFPSPAALEQVFASYGYAPGTVPWSPVVGFNSDGTLFLYGDGRSAGSVVNYRGEVDPHLYNDRALITYNTATTTALQVPLERLSMLIGSRLGFSPSAEGYLQALYAGYSTTRQLAPAGSGILLVPTTNPYIPPDLATLLASRANPDAPFRFQTRATTLGPRTAGNDRNLLQVTAGVRGRIFDEWHYDAYLQRGRNARTESQDGITRRSKYEELLFAPDGGESICGGFDVFGRGRAPSECFDYLATSAANESRTDQALAEVTLRGSLFTLPAGEVSGAIGVFHKRDEFEYTPDEVLTVFLPGVPGIIGPRPDVSGLGVGAARRGRESNTDLYVEALLPILRGETAARSLDLGVGYRRSHYDQAGGADSYKAELTIRPHRRLLVRGSLQHAVRAPSVDELYYPEIAGQFFVRRPDPCNYRSAERLGPDRARIEALCLAQGVPPQLLANFAYDLQFVDGVGGGNPALEPEEADTYTAGIALESASAQPALRDLKVAVDWYRIDFRQGIGRWPTETAITRCFDVAYNVELDPAYAYCTFFRRSPETGDAFALEIDRNIGGVDTSGIDVQLDWGANAGPGRLGANAYVNYVTSWEATEPDGRKVSYAGTIGNRGLGGSIPRWRALVGLRYEWRGSSAYLRWQHVDAMRDAEYRDFTVPSHDHVDIGASFEFTGGSLDGLGLTAGIENLTDARPPLFPSYSQANTDPAQYDVLGRRYFVSLRYRL